MLNLQVKMSAEGIALDSLKAAILAASEAAKTGGVSTTRRPASPGELEGLACVQAYGGGYMYPGITCAVVDGVDFCPPTAFVKETPIEREERLTGQEACREGILAAFENAPIGATAQFASQLSDSWEVELEKTVDGWVVVYEYDSRVEQWESQQDVYLFPGIREQVARTLGVDASSTFHAAFDAAVDSIMEAV